MTMNRKWSVGLMAVATSVMIGCTSGPATQTSPPTDQTNPVTPAQLAVTDDTITPEEETLANSEGYAIQQSSYIFAGRRCRWFWVPSRWGYGWGYSSYQNYWNQGRWVLICNRRVIPYWWHFGPFATYGSRFGRFGYDRTPPRHRPFFDRNRFDNDGRDRPGRRDRNDDDNYGGGGGGGRGGDMDDNNGRRGGDREGRGGMRRD